MTDLSPETPLEEFLSTARECALLMMDCTECLNQVLLRMRLKESEHHQLASLLPEFNAGGRALFETVTFLQALRIVAVPSFNQSEMIRQSLARVAALLRKLEPVMASLQEAAERDPDRSVSFEQISGMEARLHNIFHQCHVAAGRLCNARIH